MSLKKTPFSSSITEKIITALITVAISGLVSLVTLASNVNSTVNANTADIAQIKANLATKADIEQIRQGQLRIEQNQAREEKITAYLLCIHQQSDRTQCPYEK